MPQMKMAQFSGISSDFHSWLPEYSIVSHNLYSNTTMHGYHKLCLMVIYKQYQPNTLICMNEKLQNAFGLLASRPTKLAKIL